MQIHSPKAGKAKEKFVQDVFQSIAPTYDRMNDILSFRRHRAWRKFTMRKMNVQSGDTALDVCCGTCDWTIQLAQASKTEGAVAGLDFSANMLSIGQKKVDQWGMHGQISLTHGNAMALPFADNSFDYATIGFGLRNVADYEQVLREMRRVIKPGGTVVCLELSKPTRQPFKTLYYFYFHNILPKIGKWMAQRYESYKWLPESLSTFPDHKQLVQMFRHIGLTHVEVYLLTGGIAALHIGSKGNEDV